MSTEQQAIVIGGTSQLDRIERKLDIVLLNQSDLDQKLSLVLRRLNTMSETLDSLQKSLDAIQASNTEIAADLDTIASNQQALIDAIHKLIDAGGASKAQLEALAAQAEQIATSISDTEQKAEAISKPAGSPPVPTPYKK